MRPTDSLRMELEFVVALAQGIQRLAEQHGRKLESIDQALKHYDTIANLIDALDAEMDGAASALQRAEGELRART